MKKIKRTPQGTPIVPKDFHEWYEEIKDRWGRDSENSAYFALWKICQLGFGYGLEDALNRKLPAHSGSLTRWVSYHKSEAVESIINGYEVEESKWVVNEGDLVIRKGEHEAKVHFVESVDDDGILLVNGIKDEFFTDLDERSVGEESINYFYENFRLLAKKENLEAEKVEV